MEPNLDNIFIYCLSLFLTLLLLFLAHQIHKIWRMKSRMEHYLGDLRALNEKVLAGTEPVVVKTTNVHQDSQSTTRTCEHCKNRVTFITQDGDDLMVYECKLNDRSIALEDTCEQYVRDLHISRI